MEEQVAVEGAVHPPAAVEEGYMLVQAQGVRKGAPQAGHNLCFLRRERIGIGRVDGGQRDLPERPDFAVNFNGVMLQVHPVEQQPVLHLEFRVPADQLTLQLEHHDIHGLDHGFVRGKIRIQFFSKQCQLAQRNAVSAFQDIHIAVGQGIAQDTGNAAGAARGCAHPQDVMIAPFNVDRVMMHEDIHDAVGMRAAVKDIAHNVQAVDGKVLDEDRERDEQAVHAAGGGQGFNDRVMIAPAVAFLLSLLSGLIVLVVHEFVEEERPVVRHGAADFVARILGGQHSGQVHHVLDLLLVPGGGNLALLMVLFEDGVGIVDERAQFIGLAH